MTELIRHSYGKDGVRLVKVVRDGDWHTVHDLTVRIWLEGDFSAAFLRGDN
jgi:urate oxidase